MASPWVGPKFGSLTSMGTSRRVTPASGLPMGSPEVSGARYIAIRLLPLLHTDSVTLAQALVLQTLLPINIHLRIYVPQN